MNTPEQLQEEAREIFTDHYNCAQSVLKTCLKELGVQGADEALLLKSIIGFGGGMGYSGQVCGAVSGAVMSLSLKWGYNGEADTDRKQYLYDHVKALVDSVEDRYGTASCDGIKEMAESRPEIAGKNELDQTRCCVDVVTFCSRRVGELLEQPLPEPEAV